jgi:hypothetical protein
MDEGETNYDQIEGSGFCLVATIKEVTWDAREVESRWL